MKKKYVLVGCDAGGRELIPIFGRENIACFCDDRYKGQTIEGIEVISFSELSTVHSAYDVVISDQQIAFQLANTLGQMKIPFSFAFGSGRFFNMWKKIYSLALKGMNVGGGDDVFNSGEWTALNILKNNLSSVNPPPHLPLYCLMSERTSANTRACS